MPLSEKDRARKRASNQRYYEKHKNDPRYIEKNRRNARDAWRSNRNLKNEKRNAKNHRLGHHRLKREAFWTRAGLYIADRDCLTHDRTKWRGPGARREKKISLLADKILDALSNGTPLDMRKIQEEIDQIERGQQLARNLIAEIRQDKP